MLIGLVGKLVWKGLNSSFSYLFSGKYCSYLGIGKSPY